MSVTAIGSMPANGSSSSMNFGRLTSARVISTRRRSPPESVYAFDRASGVEAELRRAARRSRARRVAAVDRQRLEDRQDVLLDRQAAEDRRLLRQVADALARAHVHRIVGDVLRRRAATRPASGPVRPTTMPNVVVLPAPFGPEQPDDFARRRRRDRRPGPPCGRCTTWSGLRVRSVAINGSTSPQGQTDQSTTPRFGWLRPGESDAVCDRSVPARRSPSRRPCRPRSARPRSPDVP